MKVLVIEPHVDDAFLSVGWHIEKIWEETNVDILTVFSDDRRAKEGHTYAHSIPNVVRYETLGLDESKMLSEPDPERRIPELTAFLATAQTKYQIVYAPLGLQHPDHIAVSNTVKRSLQRKNQRCRPVFYLDQPYASKLKNRQELHERMNIVATRGLGPRVWSLCFPPRNKWRKHSMFGSQAKFFHFNQSLFTSKLPEMLVH